MSKPKLIQLPKFLDDRGNLSFFENDNQLPFTIRRVHWIYDVPGGEERGGVAYRTTEEFIVAMSGSFDVVVSDGTQEWKFPLNRSYMGVYIPAGYWRSVENFSTNSVAVIAASTVYDSADAIRSMEEFRLWKASNINLDKLLEEYQTSSVTQHTSGVKHSVYDCGIIELDRHHSQRKGDISVVENGKEVPFDTKRIYYLYDVPGGADRGGHAHKELYQLIVAASGSFSVMLDDGAGKRTFTLNRPYQGLLIKPGIWRTLTDFSSGSVCMVLASELYDAADYIHDYEEFLKYRK
ncbi:MAG: WxcM-like domain-containing protein [Paludibacteraceae bacterium]|nr:WxcM-like domain-containing protein [Paludibacteraceae bacterium]